MPDRQGATHPLEVESIDCSTADAENVIVRITGKWRVRGRARRGPVFLVVESDELRRRFPALPDQRRSRIGRPNGWEASFALPAWLEPELAGRSLLAIGDLAIPLPSLPSERSQTGATQAPASSGYLAGGDPSSDEPGPSAEQEGASRPEAAAASEDPQPTEHRPPAPGVPPHEHLVAALRSELQERAASEGRLRGLLVESQAELKARQASERRLESAQADLRSELAGLLELTEQERARRAELESRSAVVAAQLAEVQEHVGELTSSRDKLASELDAAIQREGFERERLQERERALRAEISSLRSQLTESSVSCDAALSEASSLRVEVDRLAAEAAAARSEERERGALGEAQALLEEVRALNARMGSAPTPSGSAASGDL